MGLYIQDEANIIYGKDGILAVKQGGCVEVWDEAGELFYGSLPEDTPGAGVPIFIRFWEQGFEHGKRIGRQEKVQEIRCALLLD